MSRHNKYKMTEEELQIWLAYAKKCHAHESNKDYSRKQKHKKNF